jgi:acyl-CoA reductase-like NAD-dependent aldehyde dehydrogenase
MSSDTTYQMYVNGAWTSSESGKSFTAYSPATGEPIGTVPEGTRKDVRQAVAAAHAASPAWARRTPFDRAALLERIAARIAARRDELAHALTLDQGKPLHAEAFTEVDDIVEYFRMSANDGRRIEGMMPPSVDPNKRVMIQRVPRGVVGLITPWNWPYEMPVEVIAPALASGNTVVWVPAPTTSICAVKLAECIVEAELPPGVFNMVTGMGDVVGDELAVHPQVSTVAFIGSIATGHKVAERAAGKELLLEMGGNGPMVVLDDADLDKAVTAAITGCLLCAGQSCSAGELILVQEAVREDFIARLKQRIEADVRLGNPFDETTTLGPLNNEPGAAKMDRHIDDAVAQGARVILGGKRAEGYPTGLYYEPTVLDQVQPEMQVALEETFGPIIPICVIRDEEQALEMVNRTEYGLLASVFTRDLRRGLRFAEAVRSGWVNINESNNWWELHLPFGGGAGSRSGIGRVGGRHVFERLTELKTIIMDLS